MSKSKRKTKKTRKRKSRNVSLQMSNKKFFEAMKDSDFKVSWDNHLSKQGNCCMCEKEPGIIKGYYVPTAKEKKIIGLSQDEVFHIFYDACQKCSAAMSKDISVLTNAIFKQHFHGQLKHREVYKGCLSGERILGSEFNDYLNKHNLSNNKDDIVKMHIDEILSLEKVGGGYGLYISLVMAVVMQGITKIISVDNDGTELLVHDYDSDWKGNAFVRKLDNKIIYWKTEMLFDLYKKTWDISGFSETEIIEGAVEITEVSDNKVKFAINIFEDYFEYLKFELKKRT